MIRYVTANLGWKILSLLIAIVLWYAIVDDPQHSMIVSAPVQFRGLSPDLDIGSDVPSTIELEVRGPSSRLTDLSGTRIPVVIDLSKEDVPGERTFSISERNIDLPSGVTFSRSIPSQLRLRLERKVSKLVPVQVRFAGPPPAGYRVAAVKTFPDKVEIRGPESHVERVEAVETDPVSLATVVSEVEFRAQLYVADPFVSFAKNEPITVRVRTERIPGS
ncbi:MAG: YbbR-like domain-containing protein [Bryobacteraceae bacterium]|nr:YbbR-like domain-containing protein [Bryobacteraceae bacterium]